MRIGLLPPATKLGQGYVFTRVCDSVNGGCVLSQHAWQVVFQHALQQVSEGGGLLLAGCLVLGWGAWPQGGLLWGGSAVGGAWSGGLLWGEVLSGDPPGTATAAGGTHPTGMHSCFILSDLFMSLSSHFLSCGDRFYLNKNTVG